MKLSVLKMDFQKVDWRLGLGNTINASFRIELEFNMEKG